MRSTVGLMVAVLGLGVAISACGSSASSTASSSGTSAATAAGAASSASAAMNGATIKAATIDGVHVLTNAQGMTLYWFAPDTMNASKCTGSCASYWPPVTGPVSAGSGVTGKLGTITRAGDGKQATYDGHPLYTYVGDTAPGEAKGNDLDSSGGLWYEMTVSGSTSAPATSASATATSGSGSSGSSGGGW